MSLRAKFLAAGKELERVGLTIMLNGEEQKVFASDLTGRQRIEFEKFLHTQRDTEGRLISSTAAAAKLVQLGLLDEDGELIFREPNDYAVICENLSSQLIEHLARAIGVVAGIYTIQQDDEEDDDGSPAETLDEDPHLAGTTGKNDLSEQGNCL